MAKTLVTYGFIGFVASLLSLQLCWGQFTIPEKPKIETSVYDYVNLLTATQKSQLEQKLIRYSDSTSTQIVIAIISSTDGENINYLGAQWGQKWGIGQAKEDNGILILLARDDRRIAINTGYGVEEYLTDFMSRRIIEKVMVPEFKNNNYYGGLHRGADAIFKVLNGQFTEDRTFNNPQPFFKDAIPFIIFLIILFIIISRNKGNRGGGNNRGGRGGRGLDIWDMIISSNMGRGGGSSGGFGGGGSFGGGGFGGGFGGGGFGGGGASGGW